MPQQYQALTGSKEGLEGQTIIETRRPVPDPIRGTSPVTFTVPKFYPPDLDNLQSWAEGLIRKLKIYTVIS